MNKAKFQINEPIILRIILNNLPNYSIFINKDLQKIYLLFHSFFQQFFKQLCISKHYYGVGLYSSESVCVLCMITQK